MSRRFRVQRNSVEGEGARRRILLGAVEILESPEITTVYVAGEPLLTMRTLPDMLTALGLSENDLELVGA
ncbi:MAG: hypothetical protein ACXVEF_07130 [Polyangiales bacterium]